MRNLRYTFALLTLSALVSTSAVAQNSTPQSIERKKMESFWFDATNNAAGAQLDQIKQFSQISLGYNHSEGDFQPTQRGRNNDSYGFSTDGGGQMENLKGTFLWGYFDYSHDKIREARYNASLIDPLRGTPFYIADQNVSDWIHQNYKLGMKAASPILANHWIVGVGLDYQNSQGAKQIDPRPNVQLSKFAITPSVVFTAGRHAVGANYTYSSRREDGTAANSISLITQPVWEVVAPGFYQTGEVGGTGFSGLRAYNANAMGGGVQYSYQSERLRLLVGGDYTFTVEDVNNDYTTPKIIGTTKENLWEAKARLSYDLDTDNTLYLKADYRDRSIDGIEYVQVFDPSFEVSEWVVISKNIRSNFSSKIATAKLEYMNKLKESYRWWAGIEAEMESLSDIYYLPRSTQDVENLYLSLFLKRNFHFGQNAILIGVEGQLKRNREADRTYSGNYAESDIYRNMVLRDYHYLASDAYLLGAEVEYTRSGLFGSRSALFVNLRYNHSAPNEKLLGGHTMENYSTLLVRAGLTF